jgi:hypothetical protein
VNYRFILKLKYWSSKYLPGCLAGWPNFREGLCQLVATAQLSRATKKKKKSQLTRVCDFTERHS